MRRPMLALILVVGTWTALAGQSGPDARTLPQLKKLFPTATAFSPKQGDPPHYKAFSSGTTLAGLAFLTTDLTPLERGYDGPIKILVGMDTQGVLAGIVVVEHKEPFGDFSIDTGGFQGQFRNKSIRDEFKVGADIDAITRATISVTTATRSVRNGARRLARAVLAPPGTQ